MTYVLYTFAGLVLSHLLRQQRQRRRRRRRD